MSYTYEDKLNFIVNIYCPIRKVAFETGMSWKTMLAQAAQETGWGEKVLPGTNNIFNIKLDSKWKGKTKTFRVWEGKKSSGRYENSKFPVFDSPEEAIYDRVDFLKRNPRYAKIFSKDILGNFEKEAQTLEDAGYATHADEKTGELIYAELLIAVYGPTMRKAIARAEEKANCAITAAVFKKGVSGELLANTKILIKTDNNNYIDKKTNSKGIVEGITSNLNGSIYFNLDSKEFSYSVANKRKIAIEINITKEKFMTKTVKHITTKNKKKENNQNTVSDNNKESDRNNKKVDEVTFNIKLVEGDTGKPLPNTTYHLEYKNNIKPHKTDSSGFESDITADVCQSIGVYLDDDDGKKQSIYSMAFPVIGDLDGQTKVLKVPVVTFSINFVENNHQPIPHYEFKTLYRGRHSAIKKANSQGISTINALAGQKLTIIDGQGRAQTTAIVTYGFKQWTMIVGTDITEENISDASDALNQEAATTPETSEPNNTPQPQTEQDPVIKVEKPRVTEVETDTETGPTLEVASDKAKITIKFVDESTNKPLSGLSYITQSIKYGKNTSVTGNDGTRGRTHDSLVGVDITVLVYEDGKEVEKDIIIANSNNNGIAYVYKAKKPEFESSLIDRAKAGKRYVKIPNNYWILGERANINRPNKFDDMIHLILGEKLIKSVKGTTHPGVQSLTNPDAYNSARTGSPVWDFGWHYGVWSKGRHRGRIDAFAHTGVAYINRDTNRNNVPDNSGASRPETGKGLNFHPASYTPTGSSSTIGTWSTGCVVVQSATDYYQIFNTIIKSGQKKLTFCVVAGDI